jgi:N-acetylneuraminic acid mutarotase
VTRRPHRPSRCSAAALLALTWWAVYALPAGGAISPWTSAASLPLARTAAGAAAIGGKIYILGGRGWGSDSYSLNTVYDPLTNTYSEAALMPATRSEMGVAVGTDKRIYAIGGVGDNGTTKTVVAYNPATNAWVKRASLPHARGRLVAVRAGTSHAIFAIGGYPSSGGRASSEMDRYSVTTNTWKSMPSLPAGRWEPAATTFRYNIYVFGGGQNASAGSTIFTPTATAYEYTTSAGTWRKLAPMPIAEQGAVALTGSDGLIYVIGGGDDTGQPVGDTAVQIYNPSTNTWSQGPAMNEPRAEGAGAMSGGIMYVFGGVDEPFQGSGVTTMSSVAKATVS